MADLGRTLAFILNVRPANGCEGRVLSEILNLPMRRALEAAETLAAATAGCRGAGAECDEDERRWVAGKRRGRDLRSRSRAD